MGNVNRCRRFWSPLVWPLLALGAGGALAEQVCKYDSIAATAPASRFTDNRDGTVTDQATGLQWKRCAEGETSSGGTCAGSLGQHYTWQQALQRADTASFADKDDWRLPNINELTSIVEEACYAPAIDLGVFSPTISGRYWSSSPVAYRDGADSAWVVDFYWGTGENRSKDYVSDILLVRGRE